MKQYIDKSAVVAEIERRIEENKADIQRAIHKHLEEYFEGYEDALVLLKEKFIDTLEVKNEILDKDSKAELMKKCVHKAYKRGYDMGVLQTKNKMNHNTKEVDLEKEIHLWMEDNTCEGYCSANIRETAEHFFGLGLKAKGE